MYVSGLYERSDAMLAIYPGGGARFARHVDNTTVCLLNTLTHFVPTLCLTNVYCAYAAG